MRKEGRKERKNNDAEEKEGRGGGEKESCPAQQLVAAVGTRRKVTSSKNQSNRFPLEMHTESQRSDKGLFGRGQTPPPLPHQPIGGAIICPT